MKTLPCFAQCLFALGCSGFAASASAQDEGLRRCRTIVESAPRLACYDALLAAPATASAPAPAPAQAQRDFGKPAQATTEVEFVETQVVGAFNGWEPDQVLVLANGQSWRVVDGSRAYVQNRNSPKARVERGAFGAFYLSVEGMNQNPRVRRVK